MLRRLVPANPCRLLRDAEVFDSASGLTRVAWPPSPIIPSEPLYPPGPMFGLVNGQTARFTVVSLLPAGSRQAPVTPTTEPGPGTAAPGSGIKQACSAC